MIERHEYEIKTCEEEEGSKQEVEPLPDKPKDANSEIVPNQNLTDDEIAQLILEEEELLDDKGVLGYKIHPFEFLLKETSTTIIIRKKFLKKKGKEKDFSAFQGEL